MTRPIKIPSLIKCMYAAAVLPTTMATAAAAAPKPLLPPHWAAATPPAPAAATMPRISFAQSVGQEASFAEVTFAPEPALAAAAPPPLLPRGESSSWDNLLQATAGPASSRRYAAVMSAPAGNGSGPAYPDIRVLVSHPLWRVRAFLTCRRKFLHPPCIRPVFSPMSALCPA